MKMYRIKELRARCGAWFMIGLPIVLLTAFLIAAATTADSTPRTIAEPPTETEITFDMEANRAYTANDGVIIIPVSQPPRRVGGHAGGLVPPAGFAVSDSEPVTSAEVTRTRRYTLPEDTMMQDGSIGVLSIPQIGLTVNVYDTDDEMAAMTHGLSHFKITSAWFGNVGVAGHNVNFDLTDGFFKHLHTLKPGDTVIYQTALGVRQYAVETVAEIAETDWSYLGRTEDDRITMITCISGKPAFRLVVQCVAI
jgi:LPXTG-site transpeptidase (sortase) family protein